MSRQTIHGSVMNEQAAFCTDLEDTIHLKIQCNRGTSSHFAGTLAAFVMNTESYQNHFVLPCRSDPRPQPPNPSIRVREK